MHTLQVVEATQARLQREDLLEEMRFLKKFWVRKSGLWSKPFKVRHLHELSLSEQLFAAILRNDESAIREMLDSSDKEILAEFLTLIETVGFARTVINRLAELNLINQVPAPILTEVRNLSIRETATHKISNRDFKQMLKLLEPVCEQLVWIKGAALSRQLYSPDEPRPFADFDVVVHPSRFIEFVTLLEAAGYKRAKDTGFCNQAGVGPTNHPSDLMLCPHTSLVPTSPTALAAPDSPTLDVKVSPLDRGMQMIGIEEFFRQAEPVSFAGTSFLAPAPVAHLTISVHNYTKDSFTSWKTLLDIHMLATELWREPQRWHEFVSSCEEEAIEVCAWAGLTMSADVFGTRVPRWVMQRLRPKDTWVNKVLAFSANTGFVWNKNSLPMLLADVIVSTDGKRKFAALLNSFLPSRQFLFQYYNRGNPAAGLRLLMFLVIHWAVIILPAGAVRTTFGKALWPRNLDGAGR